MHDAQDIHDAVVRYPIDDEVTRGTNTSCGLHMQADQACRERTDARLAGDIAGTKPARIVADGCHGGEKQETVTIGCLGPVTTGALQEYRASWSSAARMRR
jgi:hypothetical protein